MAGSKASSSPSAATDILDETLQHIRNDLSNLSTDRIAMETKVEGLVYEIQTLAGSLYNYRRPQVLQSSPVRRVRSSASPRSKSIVRKRSKGKEYDASIGKQIREKVSSKFSASSESMSNSLRERSSSASAYSSLEDIGAARLGSRSYSVEGSWKKKNTIPELPESPNLCSVTRYSHSSGASSQDSSHSVTLRSPKESPTPPTSGQWQTRHHYSSLVTSTPNMQYCGTEAAYNEEYYYTLPGKIAAGGSQPHQVFSSGHLSEVDGCLEDESQRQNKSIVMRRSSLTGQVEQFQRPLYKDVNARLVRTRANTGYKVLNKGVRNMKRRSTRLDQVILPGVETTV